MRRLENKGPIIKQVFLFVVYSYTMNAPVCTLNRLSGIAHEYIRNFVVRVSIFFFNTHIYSLTKKKKNDYRPKRLTTFIVRFYLPIFFIQEIPIVVAGNKLDLASTHREVQIEDVSEWVFCELPKLRSVELAKISGRDVENWM